MGATAWLEVCTTLYTAQRMARRHPGSYKGGARGPSPAYEADRDDGIVLGAVVAPPPVVQTPARYNEHSGATVCNRCGSWRLGDRVAEFPNCWEQLNPKAKPADPTLCPGTTRYDPNVVPKCPDGCGYFYPQAKYDEHLKTYTHYGMHTGDYEWAGWDYHIEGKDIAPEEAWQRAQAMGWMEKRKPESH